MIQNFAQQIKEKALSIGFDDCGITEAVVDDEDILMLKHWISNGYQAGMDWMERNLDARFDPENVLTNAKTVVVVLKNYYTRSPHYFDNDYKIARYAKGLDYHYVMKDQLSQLLTWIIGQTTAEGRICVDSTPVLERAFARKAGLGWIGKNSMLINKNLGSFTFIGCFFLNIEVETDLSFDKNLCGSCTRCLDACPTSAIVNNKTIDSNKCISYQTIENKKEADPLISTKNPGWIFGCDICQEVCPWNINISETKENRFQLLPKLQVLNFENLKRNTKSNFSRKFRDSPLFRAGRDKLLSNIELIKQKKLD